LLVLFDLDRTLLDTGGAGRAAMKVAFRARAGITDDLETVGNDGMTDEATFRRVLSTHGRAEQLLPLVKGAYLRELPYHLRNLQGRVLPGVPELLSALVAMPLTHTGLATGNFREGARLKVEHYSLPPKLMAGGFGDGKADRIDVVLSAIREGAQVLGVAPTAVRAVAVGDTPADVIAASGAGVPAIGVATGKFTVEELSAAGADACFPGLAETPSVLEAIQTVSRVRASGG